MILAFAPPKQGMSKCRRCRKQASTLDVRVIARNDGEISERAAICRNVEAPSTHTRSKNASTFRQNLIALTKPP